MVEVPTTEIRPRIDRGNPHFLHIPPHRSARQGAEFRSQEHLDCARPVKRGVRVDLVDPMRDCHLARRWGNRLIREAGAAEGQERGLRRERQLRGITLDQRLPFPKTQAGSFFFSQFSCVVRRPISAYRSSRCFS